MDGELQEKIAVVNALDTSIKKKDSEIQGLNDTILSEQRTAEQSRKDYESMLKDVRDELKYTKRDRDEIAKYKTNYENLDYAFQVNTMINLSYVVNLQRFLRFAFFYVGENRRTAG